MAKIKIINLFPQQKTYFIILAALIIAVFHQALFLSWTSDDAFISYRYAKNLNNGHGLVFNPGEKIEGYSNFLWVMILAVFDYFGIPPHWAAKIFPFCISLLSIFLIFKTAQAYGLNKLSSSLCSLFLSTSSSFAYYSMSGLETAIYTFLLLLSVFINEKYESESNKKSLFYLYGTLLAITLIRPEGILFLMISSGYHFLKKVVTGKGVHLKKVIQAQLLAFSIYAFLILLRYWYYSDILPNTYYAKPPGTFVELGYNALFVNFMNAFFSGSFLLIFLIPLLVKKIYLKKYAYPLLICLAQLIFMSYAGDWMALGRFFLPILPLFIILTVILSQKFILRIQHPFYKKLVMLSFVVIWIFFLASNVSQTSQALVNKYEYPYSVMNSKKLIELRERLNRNYPNAKKIATRRIGAISYYSNQKIIDILGLTDKKIASNIKTIKNIEKQNDVNSKIVLEKEPDLIILFSFESYILGCIYDKTHPQYRLFQIEYLIFKIALNRGYKIMEEKKFSENEKIIILTKNT